LYKLFYTYPPQKYKSQNFIENGSSIVKTRTKLSAALLATAAASMLSTAASADELTALKAQLDALQSRVNTMEAAPAIPGNTSLMSYQRGFGGNGFSKAERLLPQDAVSVNEDAGYTIAITPTADMPAPVAEMTVYGYIGAHLHYAFDASTAMATRSPCPPWLTPVATTSP
jgi:hypothetical protein